MVVIIIVASHSEQIESLELRDFCSGFMLHASWGGGRVKCPALSRQLIGRSNKM